MKVDISEKVIIEHVESVLPSIVSDILETMDLIDDIVSKNIEPIIKRLLKEGKLDKVLESEVERFIKEQWDSDDISKLLIKRIDDKLVFKND